MSHTPVLLNEMLDALSPKDGEVYVDATFGGGGYSRAILNVAKCRVIGIDRDPEAIARGHALEKEFPHQFQILQGTFSQIKDLLDSLPLSGVHGIVFDLGVSSYQIDTPGRGFSFRFEGPLDMRMSGEGVSAADVVNSYSEQELADIIFRYGEEKRSRAIARKIVAARAREPFQTTTQLANVVASVVKKRGDGQHPATLTFQALRIFVNNELIEIDSGLKSAEKCLLPGGRLVVVTFHSLEDRLVKQFFKERQGQQNLTSRHMPTSSQAGSNESTFAPLKGHGKGIKAGEAEVRLNPRARSARLRVGIRRPLLSHPLKVQRGWA